MRVNDVHSEFAPPMHTKQHIRLPKSPQRHFLEPLCTSLHEDIHWFSQWLIRRHFNMVTQHFMSLRVALGLSMAQETIQKKTTIINPVHKARIEASMFVSVSPPWKQAQRHWVTHLRSLVAGYVIKWWVLHQSHGWFCLYSEQGGKELFYSRTITPISFTVKPTEPF